ncbi:MAG TPA: nitrite reductase large subunit NirB [Polyangiaceae bacterium]|nr:nitrite reductase large subunit NirB [Polyangiaceae bacterium]
MSARRETLVVIGNGMVGHRLLTTLVELGATKRFQIIVFGEEPRAAYDRVALSAFYNGMTADDLSLVEPGFFDRTGITLHKSDKVVAIDRAAKRVTSEKGLEIDYDFAVMATGSYAFVPPIQGKDAAGCFVYRTIDDLIAIRDWAAKKKTGAVIGGGLLGLEAANALLSLGVKTHVVEFAPRLMPVQVDEAGGTALRRRIEQLDVAVHTAKETREIARNAEGAVEKLVFADGSELPVEMVVFSAGIRPRDDLGKKGGLEIGARGGIVVDDACLTSDPSIYAIGECALAQGQIWGLVAPGYSMARVVADRLMGGSSLFQGADLSTKLKLLGVEVASFGDAHGRTPGAQDIVFKDLVANVYKKLVVSHDAKQVLGGVMVGDASSYGSLVQMMLNKMPVSEHPEDLILPARGSGGSAESGVGAMPDEAVICSCNNVTKGRICLAIAENSLTEVGAVKACTKAGTSCGGCATLVSDILRVELKKAGVEVKNAICEHFDFSRQELFDLVRVNGISSFAELVQRHGKGRGCEICKPAVASILASLATTSYVLEGDQAALQDTNDHFLANLQKDGTYSIVPRVPGGEITPEQLIQLGTVAREFGLYTKITGGQRIDLFGARVEQLPTIWSRLLEVGFESGHAYAKALRTVKSCVGSTWCRYGVQDSVALAIEIELRYRGLRAPHKLKSAVSGCTRECAEAQSKDFGIIATERGWNLYICGNGGMRPQHAVLFASDLSKDDLIRYIDRFLMFYIRTAGRLERTATWLNKRPGGLAELKRILIDDELGICAELEADLLKHVESYECEWKATLRDPARLARFVHFVNSPEADPNVVFVEERGQRRPARPDEKPDLLAGAGVEVDSI